MQKLRVPRVPAPEDHQKPASGAIRPFDVRTPEVVGIEDGFAGGLESWKRQGSGCKYLVEGEQLSEFA